MPNCFVAEGRTRLVNALTSRFGPGVLYLPQVWAVHTSLPRWMFYKPPRNYHIDPSRKDESFDEESMQLFLQEVQQAPTAVVEHLATLRDYFESFVRCVQCFRSQQDSGDPRVEGEFFRPQCV